MKIKKGRMLKHLFGRASCIDVHNWRFTPSSFHLILLDLQMPGFTGLNLAKEFNTESCEFFVALHEAAAVFPDRLELLNRVRVNG